MNSKNQLQRGLKSRHLTMMALGGTIGIGLFLASGNAIHMAGAGGAILGYIAVGFLVYFVMTSLGEMAAYRPITGSFCDYASRYVDPAFGFAMSWNYWLNWVLVVASEIIGAGVIMQYWFPQIDPLWWSVLFFLIIIALNLFAVRVYGESEYMMAFIKIATVIIFIIVGMLVIFGLLGSGPAVGFKNITIGDGPFYQGWLGFLSVFLIAGYSFQGTELVGVAVGEADNPKRSIPRAIRTIFWRIMLFYVLTITVISFLIPYTDPNLVSSGHDLAMSPLTIVLKSAGLQYAATIINLVVVTAILSTANASLYTASRVLWHVGHSSHGARVLQRTTIKGVPVVAIVVSVLFCTLFILSSLIGSGVIFTWLVNIISVAGYIAWFGICLSHFRFRRAYLAQGYAVNQLPFIAKWFPFAPLCAMVLIPVMMFGSEVLNIYSGKFNWHHFVATFWGLGLFLLAFLGYKLFRRTSLLPLHLLSLAAD